MGMGKKKKMLKLKSTRNKITELHSEDLIV